MVNKEKVIIYGAGGTGKALYQSLSQEKDIEIIAFADSFKRGQLEGLPILSPPGNLISEI